jgi:hypothetical protein
VSLSLSCLSEMEIPVDHPRKQTSEGYRTARKLTIRASLRGPRHDMLRPVYFPAISFGESKAC